jgi:hypothetical protein
LSLGAVHDSDAVLIPAVGLNDDGASGLDAGVHCIVAGDDRRFAILIEITLNVYGVPFVKPTAVNVVDPEILKTDESYVIL